MEEGNTAPHLGPKVFPALQWPSVEELGGPFPARLPRACLALQRTAMEDGGAVSTFRFSRECLAQHWLSVEEGVQLLWLDPTGYDCLWGGKTWKSRVHITWVGTPGHGGPGDSSWRRAGSASPVCKTLRTLDVEEAQLSPPGPLVHGWPWGTQQRKRAHGLTGLESQGTASPTGFSRACLAPQRTATEEWGAASFAWLPSHWLFLGG